MFQLLGFTFWCSQLEGCIQNSQYGNLSGCEQRRTGDTVPPCGSSPAKHSSNQHSPALDAHPTSQSLPSPIQNISQTGIKKCYLLLLQQALFCLLNVLLHLDFNKRKTLTVELFPFITRRCYPACFNAFQRYRWKEQKEDIWIWVLNSVGGTSYKPCQGGGCLREYRLQENVN